MKKTSQIEYLWFIWHEMKKYWQVFLFCYVYQVDWLRYINVEKYFLIRFTKHRDYNQRWKFCTNNYSQN